MATHNNDHDGIAQALAAYGSDVARWPSSARTLFERLPEDQRQSLLQEEAGLDALIRKSAARADNAAPPPALMNRIMQAAHGEAPPVHDAQDDTVVAMPQSIRPPQGSRHHAPRANVLREWQAAAALLAASLVLGLFVGSTDLGRSAVGSVGDLAGLSNGSASVQMSALDEAMQSTDDEDLL